MIKAMDKLLDDYKMQASYDRNVVLTTCLLDSITIHNLTLVVFINIEELLTISALDQ